MQSEQRAKHVRELVRSLADWAQSQKALNAVIQLPLNQLEEQVGPAKATSHYYPAYAQCAIRFCSLHEPVGMPAKAHEKTERRSAQACDGGAT